MGALDKEVEEVWESFWLPIVAPDGVVDLDQVKRELFDFKMVIGEVSLAYDAITGGRISKPNTASHHVIEAAWENIGSFFGEDE